MIRRKGYAKTYQKLRYSTYHLRDIAKEPWSNAIRQLTDVIREDSRQWKGIFCQLLDSLKLSAFYWPVTTFSDWNRPIKEGDLSLKYVSQLIALKQYYAQVQVDSAEPGEARRDALRPPGWTSPHGVRLIFRSQWPRVRAYSRDTLYEMLYQVAELGQAIPLSGWEVASTYGGRVAQLCTDYTAYLRAVYLLPPSWYLMEAIKPPSWFHLLKDAGVLSDGVMKSPRGVRCVASDGHVCHSLAELEIDNWLSMHGIEHEREPRYPHHPELNPQKRLRADWQVKDIFIEYAGLMNTSAYRRRMEHKEEIARASKITLLVLHPEDLDRLEELLSIKRGHRTPRRRTARKGQAVVDQRQATKKESWPPDFVNLDWDQLKSLFNPIPKALPRIGPSQRFLWKDGIPIFAFGRHGGKPIHEVAREDDGAYLQWMLMEDFDEHDKSICRQALRCGKKKLVEWLLSTFGPPPPDESET